MTNISGQNSNNNNKLNLSSIKQGFKEYLEDLALKNSTEAITPDSSFNTYSNSSLSSSASIFLHADEFKTYLTNEIGIDSSLLTKNINEILESINDGTLLTELEEEQEQNNAIDTDKILSNLENLENEADLAQNEPQNEPQEGTQTPSELDEARYIEENSENVENSDPNDLNNDPNNIVFDLLSEVFQDAEISKVLDTDGVDGLSKEELTMFLDIINSDNNENELTLDELIEGVKSILDGSYQLKQQEYLKNQEIEQSQQITPEETQNVTPQEVQTTPTQAMQASSPSRVSGGGGYSNYSSNGSSNRISSNQPHGINSMTLPELNTERTKRQTEVDTKQKELDEITSGNKFKTEEQNLENLKSNYEETLKNDENVSDELKEALNNIHENISNKEQEITDLDKKISDNSNNIFNIKNEITQDDANLAALNQALASYSNITSDNENYSELMAKKAQLEQKIQQVTTKKAQDEKTLRDLELEQSNLNTQKQQKEEELNKLKNNDNPKGLQQIESEISNTATEPTKQLMEEYNKAKSELDETKSAALKTATDNLTQAQQSLQEVTNRIAELEANNEAREYRANDYNFDFDLNLSDSQKADLENFKQRYEENIDRYKAVEDATGVPSELIAALHWRESGGQFDTYLHNGQKLGTVTTCVPKGIYFTDWTEAAIDALQGRGGVDKNDLDSYYDFAERYNGLGYRNKGVASPYVWAGTDKYTGGKYVADGVYDPNHYDQQLGVAVMLQSIMS